jgi:hypothetical protein
MCFWVQFFLILRWLPAVPQQELTQSLACTLLILSGIVAGADQIAQCFVRGVRNPHRREGRRHGNCALYRGDQF